MCVEDSLESPDIHLVFAGKRGTMARWAINVLRDPLASLRKRGEATGDYQMYITRHGHQT